MLETRRIAAFLALCAGFLAAAASTQSVAATRTTEIYVKKDTWPETVIASRGQYVRWLQSDPSLAGLKFGPWYSTGPVAAKGFQDALFPEKGVDLTAKGGSRPLWRMAESGQRCRPAS